MDAFKDKVTLCLQFQNGSENKSVCVCMYKGIIVNVNVWKFFI